MSHTKADQWLDDIQRAREYNAEIERLRHEIGLAHKLIGEMTEERSELLEQRDALLAALKECADDLEASIEAEYKNTLDYPSQQRRYERDMTPVRNARAAIKAAEGEG